MQIDISIQDYFWMVDRLELQDDPRNKVNAESQTVTLGKEMSNSLKNGFLFGKLLQKMQSTYIKRTRKFFNFSAEMLEIKDNDRLGNRKTNWGYLIAEMKNFGIEFDSSTQQRIQEGNPKQICQLLDQLFETDNAPSVTSGRSGSHSRLSIVGLKNPDNNSHYSGSLKNSSQDISNLPQSARGLKLVGKLEKQKEAPSTSGSMVEHSTTAKTEELQQIPRQRSTKQNVGKLATRASRVSNVLNSENEHQKSQINVMDQSFNPQLEIIGGRDISPIRNQSPGPSPKRLAPQKTVAALVSRSVNKSKSQASSESPKRKDKTQVSSMQDLTRKNNRLRGNGRHQASQKQNPLENLNDEIVDDLSLTETSFQFVINSLSMAFEMKPKQALGLLADNQQYLMHICVKGMKGHNFEKVKTWYHLAAKDCQHLAVLLNNELPASIGTVQVEPKTLFKTLNIFKGGFYSKDKQVAKLCVGFFNKLNIEINEISGEIVGETWEWFARSTAVNEKVTELSQISKTPQQKKKAPIPQSKTPKSINTTSKKAQIQQALNLSSNSLIDQTVSSLGNHSSLQEAFLDMLMQTGLQGILYAMQRDNSLRDQVAILLMNFGKHNPMELFTDQLQHFSHNWDEYAAQCQWLFLPQIKTELFIETIQESGVLSYWVLQCLRVAEGQIDITLDDRIQSLVFLTEIWLQTPNFISNTLVSSGPAILSILKRASRDVKQTLFIVSIELMFRLLENFAVTRNASAPFVYKTLTFLLVEFYWEIEIREMMLKHFVYLFKKLETIPISILCEPLLKQVSISQYHFSSFNVFDFEFFQTVAYHKKLTLQTALMMTDTLTKIALSSVFYAQTSINVLKTLIMRFSKSPETLQHWQQQFRNIIATMQNMEIRKQQHNNSLTKNDKKFFNRLSMKGKAPAQNKKQESVLEAIKLTKEDQATLKINEKLLVNFFDRLIDLGNDLLSEELRLQLLDMYISLQQAYKLESKPIKYLLVKYGFDLTLMIEQRKSITVIDPILNGRTTEQSLNDAYGVQKNEPQINEILNKSEIKPTTERFSKNQMILEQDQTLTENLLPQKLISAVSPYLEQEQVDLRKPSLQVTPKHIQNTKTRAMSHKHESEPRGKQVSSKVRSVKSLQQSMETISLYNYEKIESSVNVLRYKKALKRQVGLYRALFNAFAGPDIKGSVKIDKKTFEDHSRQINMITVQGLMKMIHILSLDEGKSSKKLREEVSNLTKLINLNLVKKTRVDNLVELDFNCFQEFLLQFFHLLFNERVNAAFSEEDRELFKFYAYQLQEKCFAVLKEANEKRELNLPKQHFETDQDDLITALTTKVNQDKNYQLPKGYTKVQQKVIKDIYEVPNALGLPESFKISIEILDQLVASKFGVHIIAPTPVVEVVSKVKPDRLQPNLIDSMKINQHARLSVSPKMNKDYQDNKRMSSILNSSNQSISLVNLASPQSQVIRPQIFKSKNNTQKSKVQTSNAYTSFPTEKFSTNFGKTSKTLTAAMQLAILEAPQEDQAITLEVASILNEVITAVETNKERSPSVQRHMSKYISRKTLRKQKEDEKTLESQEFTEEQRRERAKSLKLSMMANDQFIQKQIEMKKKENQERMKKAEIDKFEKEKKEKLQKQKFDKVKDQLRAKEQLEKEKKEQEDQLMAEETKKKEELAKQERKMLMLRRKQFAKDVEIKSKEKKEKEEKERLEKEEKDRIAKKELALKLSEIVQKRNEMAVKKKDTSKSRGRRNVLSLQKNESGPKLSKTEASPKRAKAGEVRQSTHLAKVEPLLREETAGNSTVDLLQEQESSLERLSEHLN